MTEQPVSNQIVHRWYTRPVLFVADVHRALRFYVDGLLRTFAITSPSAPSPARNRGGDPDGNELLFPISA